MGGGSSKGSKGSKRPSSAPSPRPGAAEPEPQDQHVPPAFNPAASTLVLELELEPEPEAQLQTVVAQPQLERRMSWVLRAELDVSAAPTVAELPPVPTPCRFEYSFALERSVFREVQEAGRGGSAVVWSWDAGGNRDAAAAAAWRAYSKAESAQLEAAWEVTGKKTRHLRHSNVKTTFLPRRARNKHRERSKRDAFSYRQQRRGEAAERLHNQLQRHAAIQGRLTQPSRCPAFYPRDHSASAPGRGPRINLDVR